MSMRTFAVFLFLYIALTVLSTTAMSIGSDGQVVSLLSISNGYVTLENTDVIAYPYTDGQGAIFKANDVLYTQIPLAGSFFALLNNAVVSKVPLNFLQQGLVWYNRNPRGGDVVWTSSAYGLIAQDYPLVPYINSNTYDFVIAYLSPYWYLCANNLTNGNYECRAVTANNSTLREDLNTSIFVENAFTTDIWKSYIKGNFKIERVDSVRDGIAYQWTSVHRHTGYGCTASVSYPPIYNSTTGTGAVKGSPTFYTPVVIRKSGVPIRC